MVKCQFCDNEFATKYVMKNHQKYAKFCLKLQNEPIPQEVLIEEDHTHFQSLLCEKDKIIADLTDKNITLKNQLTKKKNNFPGVLKLDAMAMRKVLIPHLNPTSLQHGFKRVIGFIADKCLRLSDGQLLYKCTDPSRHMFQFKNENDEIERDFKAAKLLKCLNESGILEYCRQIIGNPSLVPIRDILDYSYISGIFLHETAFCTQLAKSII